MASAVDILITCGKKIKSALETMSLWFLLIGSIYLIFTYPVLALIALGCIAGGSALHASIRHYKLDEKFVNWFKASKQAISTKLRPVKEKLCTFFQKLSTFLFGKKPEPATPATPVVTPASATPVESAACTPISLEPGTPLREPLLLSSSSQQQKKFAQEVSNALTAASSSSSHSRRKAY